MTINDSIQQVLAHYDEWIKHLEAENSRLRSEVFALRDQNELLREQLDADFDPAYANDRGDMTDDLVAAIQDSVLRLQALVDGVAP